MKINIKNSVNWIYKRFKDAKESKYSSFKVTENDIKTFLDIVRYIDIQREEKVAKNTLFAKLYVYHLNQLIDIYDTDVLENIPQKELSKLLNTPLDYYFTSFHNKIQNKWHDKMCDKIIQGKDIRKEYVKEKYTLEYVEEKLTEMMNEALIRFE